MPRNRSDVARDEKVDEIVEAAVTVLKDGGYDALSLSGIARDLGLARGAIHWYFPSKDDLFVAAVQRAFADALADPPRRADLVRSIGWAIERLTELRVVYSALHGRAHASARAAEVEAAVQGDLRARLRESVGRYVSPGRVQEVSDAIGVFVEGVLARRLPARERDELLDFVVTRLVDDPSARPLDEVPRDS